MPHIELTILEIELLLGLIEHNEGPDGIYWDRRTWFEKWQASAKLKLKEALDEGLPG